MRRSASTRFLILIGIIGLVAFVIFFTASGEVIEQTRDIDDFNRIEVDGVGSVNITISDETALTIRANERQINNVRTEVEGNTLQLDYRANFLPFLGSPGTLVYTLTTPTLNGIEIEGTTDVLLQSPIETERFEIKLNGTGNITLPELNADTLTVESDGTGQITINGGNVNIQTLDIDGTGDYNALELSSNTTEVDLNGTATVTISVSEVLRGETDGTGDLSYRGNPSIDVDTNGLSELIRLDG